MSGWEVMFRILWTGVLGGLICGSAMWLQRPAALSGDMTGGGSRPAWILVGMSYVNAVVIIVIMEMKRRIPGENSVPVPGMEEILCSLLAGGLLAAACMDAASSYVYNYVWWWCLLWTGILLAFTAGGRVTAAVPVFVILQQVLFARMYGRADCHAFSVCALAGSIWQGELLWFLIHMLSAVILLAVVQLLQGNVTRRGRLHTPKPFVPYIVVTFWAELPVMLYLQRGVTHIYA